MHQIAKNTVVNKAVTEKNLIERNSTSKNNTKELIKTEFLWIFQYFIVNEYKNTAVR